ncbi:MAG: prephenate/arogenate dehydrogenase family protein [Sphingomonadales bacterium]
MTDGPGTSPVFDTVALVGLGLIGSSLARGIRQRGLARRIVACVRPGPTADKVRELGLADDVHDTAAQGVATADLVILCTPVGAYAAIAREMGASLKAGATVSDVGSVKGKVIGDIAPHLPDGVHFVPAHPVAGTEQSGPEAGFAELFDNRWCILTPPPGANEGAVAKVRAFWEGLGSNVEMMDAAHHDLVLAITSHVPHLIAYNIVGTARHLETVTDKEVIKYSAGGFRDFTRIAASDPTMWRDVFLANKDAVLEMLGRFTEDLTALQRAIRFGDGDALFSLFTHTRAIRREIIDAGQETGKADFGRNNGKPL